MGEEKNLVRSAFVDTDLEPLGQVASRSGIINRGSASDPCPVQPVLTFKKVPVIARKLFERLGPDPE